MEWRGINGDWSDTFTWLGGADSGGLPHGFGTLAIIPYSQWEGSMAAGRRQGLWIRRKRTRTGPAWCSVQFKDDILQDESSTVRPNPRAGATPRARRAQQ